MLTAGNQALRWHRNPGQKVGTIIDTLARGCDVDAAAIAT